MPLNDGSKRPGLLEFDVEVMLKHEELREVTTIAAPKAEAVTAGSALILLANAAAIVEVTLNFP